MNATSKKTGTKKLVSKKIITILAFATFLTIQFFVSCKSTQKLFNQSNLTILVLDENDMPVNGFEINLVPVKKLSGVFEKSGITNQNGMTVFYNAPLVPYLISGQKEGYSKIKPQEINIQANGDLFCYRVLSADYLLLTAEQLYSMNKFLDALELLENIECQKNQALVSTVSFYKAFGYAKTGQKEKAGFALQTLKEADNPAFETSLYCEAIEEMLAQIETPGQLEAID